MKWISESQELPLVAQQVLLATPRQTGDFWDIRVVRLLVKYEEVRPAPVRAGMAWPTDYWWSEGGRSPILLTGSGWWASLRDIPLPPGARHENMSGFDLVVQIDASAAGREEG